MPGACTEPCCNVGLTQFISGGKNWRFLVGRANAGTAGLTPTKILCRVTYQLFGRHFARALIWLIRPDRNLEQSTLKRFFYPRCAPNDLARNAASFGRGSGG